jgi:hypothetical protein
MVDTNNAKSKHEFKKLSENMGNKLDKEKGWYVFLSLLYSTLHSFITSQRHQVTQSTQL